MEQTRNLPSPLLKLVVRVDDQLIAGCPAPCAYRLVRLDYGRDSGRLRYVVLVLVTLTRAVAPRFGAIICFCISSVGFFLGIAWRLVRSVVFLDSLRTTSFKTVLFFVVLFGLAVLHNCTICL